MKNGNGASRDNFKHLEELLLGVKESLERELHDFREETRVNFDRLDGAVRRHSAMILAGTTSIGTLTKTVTRLEDQMRVRDAQIRELKDRVRRLERGTRP